MFYRVLMAAVMLSVQQASTQSLAFEVVSIKPSTRPQFPANIDEEDPCSAALPGLAGRTLATPAATLYALIALAYNPWSQPGGGCAHAMRSGLIAGGPTWMKSDRYAIQAQLPDGADVAAYERLLATGAAGDLQRMLQTMLVERFRLSIRHENREMAVYLLELEASASRARSLMAQSAASGEGIRLRLGQGVFSTFPVGQDGGRYVSIAFHRQPIVRLAQRLSTAVQRPILNRTGLDGEFDFVLEYDDAGLRRPTLFTAIREQLGFRLLPSRALVDVLVVEHADRPSAN